MEQEVRYCTTPDGVRIAYATAGSGSPLVKAANWIGHLEFEWRFEFRYSRAPVEILAAGGSGAS